ncbi:hypothetical protein Tco_0986950 [Tanacetum coccineum]
MYRLNIIMFLSTVFMNELVNDGIKLLKLEINTRFINGLPNKWLSFCQSLINANHVRDYELASLFGKLKYGENQIDSIYDTEKKKSLTTATPLSTTFISASIVQYFQDSLDDEEDTRSSQEYINDLEMEFHERALLAKSKIFFKKAEDTNASRLKVERPWLYEAEVIMNVIDSSVTDFDSAEESTSICSTSLPSLENLLGAEPQTEFQPKPKTIKSILKACSTRKAETLKDVVINETINSSYHAKGTKNVSASKRNTTSSGKLRNVKTKDDILMFVSDIRKPIWYLDSGCSRHMTGVKSYLHKYVEQPGLRWYFEMTLYAPLKDMILLNVMLRKEELSSIPTKKL